MAETQCKTVVVGKTSSPYGGLEVWPRKTVYEKSRIAYQGCSDDDMCVIVAASWLPLHQLRRINRLTWWHYHDSCSERVDRLTSLDMYQTFAHAHAHAKDPFPGVIKDPPETTALSERFKAAAQALS
jgi:hypothetical protein